MDKSILLIGSGIGGLSCGVKLAQQGIDVTLFEKEPRTGGYATSFSRRGYHFDLALHVVPSGGPGQEFASMVNSLGLADDIKFIRLKQGFNVILGDYRFQMPNSYSQLIKKLCLEFPAEKENIHRFSEDLEKHVTRYIPIFDYTIPNYRALPSFLPKIPAFLKHCKQGTKGYLKQFFNDGRIIAILFQPAAFMGIPMRDFPAVNFMMMFYLLMKNGMYTIAGGGQALTSSLKKRFQQLGGTLITKTQVERIIIKDRMAVGVMTSEGREYRGSSVIAANNIYDVVNDLVGRSYFSKSYLDNLDSLSPSISVLALNLGIDCHPKDLGVNIHISMIFPDSDIDRCMDEQRQQIDINGFSITAHCNSEPESVDNKHYSLSLIGGTDPDQWLTMSDEEYYREKERIIKQLINKTEALFPGLKSHIQVTDLATPRTMQRYTANPSGSIMGFNCTCGSHRQIMQAANIPISNLSMGGAWTSRLGGFMQSMKSGILAAEQIKS